MGENCTILQGNCFRLEGVTAGGVLLDGAYAQYAQASGDGCLV